MFPTVDLAPMINAAAAAILVVGLRDDPGIADGYVRMYINNGHIQIQTKRIDGVVAAGPAALNALVYEMERDGVSLDTFARCYTACDQILRKAGLKECVSWYGGLFKIDREKGRVVGTSRIDGYSAAFRQQQVKEIVSGAKQIGLRVGVRRS